MCSVKTVFLKISQNSEENTCARVSFFNKVAGLMSLALVSSFEFCEIFKKTYFYRTPLVAASENGVLKNFLKFTRKYLCWGLFAAKM